LSEARQELLAVDLDGTLVDSAPDIAYCLGLALESVGCSPPGEARTRLWIGDGLETLIGRALEHVGRADLHRPALAAFLACYRDNLFVRSHLYPGAVETLDALLARGVRLCCITNKRLELSEALLRQAGILDRFELVLGGDSLPEKKPSPLPLATAVQTLGVDPGAATLVGDSHQDLRAARSAGYAFILATYGYGKVDESEVGASPRIRQFTELLSLIGGPQRS
jgi:phosphoglycolate phosphatase